MGHSWARANGLDVEISALAGPLHDWAHATFDLGPPDEGIVFAIEECFEAGQLPTLDYFEERCVQNWTPGDTWVWDDMAAAYERVVEWSRSQ